MAEIESQLFETVFVPSAVADTSPLRSEGVLIPIQLEPKPPVLALGGWINIIVSARGLLVGAHATQVSVNHGPALGPGQHDLRVGDVVTRLDTRQAYRFDCVLRVDSK